MSAMGLSADRRASWARAPPAAPTCRRCRTKTIIVKEQGTIFLAGPPLVRAATGEVVSAEELGGGDVHTRLSGVADHLANDDAHALALARRIVANLNTTAGNARRSRRHRRIRSTTRRRSPASCRPSLRTPYDIREVIARIVDGSRFDEFKARYGTTLVTGFAHVHGIRSASSPTTACCFPKAPSRARILSSCARSAASRWSSCRTSPASWSGAEIRGRRHRQGRRQAGDGGGDDRRCPRSPCSSAASFGAGNYGMCGRAYSPRFLWTWPNAPDFGDGRRAGRGRAGHGQARRNIERSPRRPGATPRSRELQAADHRSVRGPGPARSTPRRGCGTTASSTRAGRGRCWRCRFRLPSRLRSAPAGSACSGCRTHRCSTRSS